MITETICVHGSDRASAYMSMNKIVRFGDKTHVTFLKYEGGSHRVAIKTYDHTTREWSPDYLNEAVYDNHCSAVIAVDSEGYLHIVYGKHVGGGVFKYRKSKKPNDAGSWEDFIVVGTDAMTYPSMVIDSKDTIHLIYRSDTATTQRYRRKPKDGGWSSPTTIISAPAGYYASYMCSIIIDNKDVLHVGVQFYHVTALCRSGYMKSTDGGNTWRRTDGTLYSLPVTYDAVETLETMSNTRLEPIAVDDENLPMLGVARLNLSPADILFCRWDKEKWFKKSLSISDREVIDGGLSFYNGIIYFYVSAPTKGNKDFEHPSAEIYLFHSRDKGASFDLTEISEHKAEAHFLPNAERKNGANVLKDIRLLWSAGATVGTVKVNLTSEVIEVPAPVLAGIPIQATVVVALLLITIVLVAFWKRREITAYLTRWRYGV